MFGKNNSSPTGSGGKGNKDQITTLVGEGASFEGNITTSSARIDGTFKGEAKLYGSLIVGEKGLVFGDVSSPNVIVFGKIDGKVKANNLDIKESGNVEGDITVQTLTVDSGGTFNGSSVMKHTESSKETESKAEVTSFQEFKSQK